MLFSRVLYEYCSDIIYIILFIKTQQKPHKQYLQNIVYVIIIIGGRNRYIYNRSIIMRSKKKVYVINKTLTIYHK